MFENVLGLGTVSVSSDSNFVLVTILKTNWLNWSYPDANRNPNLCRRRQNRSEGHHFAKYVFKIALYELRQIYHTVYCTSRQRLRAPVAAATARGKRRNVLPQGCCKLALEARRQICRQTYPGPGSRRLHHNFLQKHPTVC